jgi:serine/threonine protein kinase
MTELFRNDGMSCLPELCQTPGSDETVTFPARLPSNIQYGPYRLLQRLNAGGMGEVYLAEDPRLARNLVLKMLPEQFSRRADRVRRFMFEARAAAALNHPNIVSIFDIGEARGRHYIAAEYIQGQTLRQRMTSPLAIAVALDTGIQVASALTAAHEAGVIHRDIKPENIMLRPDGLVKVLDFGIAKLADSPSTARSSRNGNSGKPILDEYATTFEMCLKFDDAHEGTAPGIILGTVNYMSPEQLRRQKVDARSDVFGFGILLYEMITGRTPFLGQTEADKIAAILEHEPEPLVNHRPDTPPDLEPIISKTLRKDRELRYQTSRDLLTELKHLKENLDFKERLKLAGEVQARGPRERRKTSRQTWKRGAVAASASVVFMASQVVATWLSS